ncbi:hypothetical protein K491DRAFT_762000 [Lophiostoma macrostomum CBS 122681]|uniref:Zn(2)-C6 fungal-type domain-containing protein n=1 Tax=Lophiostoma macrostomum CBS 122681 TaxID=1314788 RepID=A0A6A6SV05_9PLEO|nr:hypothetical protein K491DRAFT_762000 [Lophiostoma macrostomum CBS 122681]
MVKWSKACGTCLRRRKGCDQQRPACGQCRKVCIPCEGYGKTELQFMNASASTIEHARARRRRNKSPSGLTPSNQKNDISHAGITLISKAVEDGIVNSFWQAYLPNSRELPLDVAHEVMGGWLLSVQALYSAGDRLVRSALLAVALTTTRGASADVMHNQGFRLYNAAVGEVSSALVIPEKSNSDSLLAAVRLFTLYECLYSSRATRLDKLDEVAPVSSQTSTWLAHHLIMTAMHIIFTHLLIGRITPFALPEWQTTPWEKHRKTPRDHLVDIFARLTYIIGSLNEHLVACDSSRTYEIWNRLHDMCISADEDMSLWNARFGEDTRASLPTSSCDDAIPATARQLAAAHLMSVYWQNGVVLQLAIWRLIHVANMLGLNRGQSRLGGLHTDTEHHFRCLIRLLPVFFGPAVGDFRMFLAVTPIVIAMRFLENAPCGFVAEQAILKRCLETPLAASMVALAKVTAYSANERKHRTTGSSEARLRYVFNDHKVDEFGP